MADFEPEDVNLGEQVEFGSIVAMDSGVGALGLALFPNCSSYA